MPGFRRFLEGVSPYSQPDNPFMLEFWQRTFNCICTECHNFGGDFNPSYSKLMHV